MPDGSFLAQGYAPTKHRVKLTARTNLKTITAFRLELLNDAELPLNGPGRSIKGTGALTEFEVEVAPADAPSKVQRVTFSRASADVNPPEAPLDPIFDDKSGQKRVTGPVAFAIDGKDETAWGIDIGPGRRNVPRKAVFNAAAPLNFPAGAIVTFYLRQNHGGWNSDDNQNCNLGRFRLSITSAPNATADPLSKDLRAALSVQEELRSLRQNEALFSYWRTTVADWKDANDRIEALWKTHPEGSTQLVLAARETPRTTSVLMRGDFLKPVKTVTPGVPAFLNALPDNAAPSRLSFARWLVDRKAPTTARAAVNRVWQAYFGTGIVSTPEELGTQCDSPSHPELLDWLAVEFMDRGWSLKQLHRVIVQSATYRQESNITPALLAKDPYNRLLARAAVPGRRRNRPRHRPRGERPARSEARRPQRFPPAPAFLFQPPVSYGPKVWPESTGGDRYRRALYTFRYRSVPYPVLQTFDAPNGDFACVRRTRSNTPLQALATLNEPEFLECARALALLSVTQGGATDTDRLVNAFRRCVARKPTPAETSTLLSLLDKETKRFSANGVDPWEIIAANPSEKPKLADGVTPARQAAWTVVSRVLLNLDETITKE